jgi:hypothetical protein
VEHLAAPHSLGRLIATKIRTDTKNLRGENTLAYSVARNQASFVRLARAETFENNENREIAKQD